MYLLFDIGGTNIRMAVSKDGLVIDAPLIHKTPQDFDEGMNLFATMVSEVSQGVSIIKSAGGVAGTYNRRRQCFYSFPHLLNWDPDLMKRKILEIMGTDVVFDNDAALAGLGEACFGAGRGFSIVSYITLSTGIGGARIIDGKLDSGIMNAEPGHQILNVNEVGIKESGTVSWESLVSGSALEKKYSMKPQNITDEKIWDREIDLISAGIVNTVLHWSPDVVVLGGGLMKSNFVSADKIKNCIDGLLTIYPIHPEIIESELGDFGGLYGALSLLK